MNRKSLAKLCLILGLLSGVLYNSWPLGYILDTSTAKYGLASDLELAHHPYAWVFITGDCLSSLAAIMLAYLLLFKFKFLSSNCVRFTSIGLIIFGVFTTLDSLLPEKCSFITKNLDCSAINPHAIGLDSILSSLAALGVLTGLICLCYYLWQKINMVNRIINIICLTLWSISGLIFVDLALNNKNPHNAQLFQLIMMGVALAVIGYDVYLEARLKA